MNAEIVLWSVFGVGMSLDMKEILGILLKLHHVQ